MSTITRCDGCQRQLRAIDDRVTIEREEPLGITYVPGLPKDGEPLHWCRDCALFAIAALDRRSA
jgi:hypothetical protein